MKTLTTAFCFFFFAIGLTGQVNFEFLSQFNIDDELNDIWGYTAQDGREYALTGGWKGVYIVDVTDPRSPSLVFFYENNPSSSFRWFDIKTWGDHAYVMPESGSSSMMILNLSTLPDSVSYHFWDNASGPEALFKRAHNCWIDEYGYGYLSSSSFSTDISFIDFFSDPDNPKYIGGVDAGSTHDVYVKNNIMYAAGGSSNDLNIYDVSDKSSPFQITSATLSGGYAHSAWLSSDGKTLFTAEETNYAPISSFNVTDLNDVFLMDEFRMPYRYEVNSIPHNVFEKDGFLIISHYIDGVLIVDANEPDNLIQVGQFDTSGKCSGYSGAFGVYPYLPSGNIIVSDRDNGIFVLKPTFQKACFLEGKIKDKESGLPVFGAKIKIISSDNNEETSGLVGKFKTGQLTSGNFDVLFKKEGYFDKIINVDFQSGKVETIEVDLEKLIYPETVKVVEKNTEVPIPDASITIEQIDTTIYLRTNAQGVAEWPSALVKNYTIHAGKWGWRPEAITPLFIPESKNITLQLERGYADNFALDLGWEISGDAVVGEWEIGIPNDVPSKSCGRLYSPVSDAPEDIDKYCFVTGNERSFYFIDGISIFDYNEDVEGTTIITSPKMLLKSSYIDPILSYSTWFVNDNKLQYNALTGKFTQSTTLANDSLLIFIDNGKQKILLDTITDPHDWRLSPSFYLKEYIEITDEMRIIVKVSDLPETPHFTEAAFDNFKIIEGVQDGDLPIKIDPLQISVFPNPFSDHFELNYKTESVFENLEIIVFNSLGQIIEKRNLVFNKGNIEIGKSWSNGIYFLTFRIDKKLAKSVKIIKTK